MTRSSLHWCVNPVKDKHIGNFKRVIYHPECVRDVKPFVCLICHKRYSSVEIDVKSRGVLNAKV